MEGADSGSLLIRAPVSLPEESELAPGASTFSEDEDFFLSGEEDGGDDDFEDVSKPVLLQKVSSMPKARVSGEDDDVAELFDDGLVDDEDGASALPGAATVVIEENGHSNGDGEVLEKEEKETSNEEISVEDSMGDVSGEGSKLREEHAVAVKDDETSNREENLRVDLEVDEIDQEENLREDPLNPASGTDFPAYFPSDEVDMESKLQVNLVTPVPATDLPGDSPSDEIDKESELPVGLVTPAPAIELLEDSQVDQTSKESKLQVGLVTPAPATDLPEDFWVDQTSKESKFVVGLDTSARATEFSKDSQADEASKESELQVGVVTPAPATEFHEDHQIDEKINENKLQQGVVTSAPHTEFPEDSQADETSIESKFLDDLVSPSLSTEFHEDSQSDDTGKQSKLEDELVTTPPLVAFHGDSLVNETKKESKSQEDLLSSSPSTKLNEESHADEVNKLEEELVIPAPLAKFHEDSQAIGTNKENSSPPAEFHEDSQVEETGKDAKLQEEPITPAPPTEIHEDSQADGNSRERNLPEDSVTVSPSTEFQVLQEPAERDSSISEVETKSEEILASGSTAGDPLECLPQKDETNHEQTLTDGHTGDKTGKERAINENLELSSEDELADLINGLLDGAGNFDAVVGQDDTKPSVSQTEEEKPIASEKFVEQPVDVEESKVSLSEGKTHAQKPSEVEENLECAEEKKDFVLSEKEEKVMGSGDNENESETGVFKSKDKEVGIKLDEDLKLDIQEVLMPPIVDSDEDLDPIEDDSKASDDEDVKIEESTKFKEQLDNVSLATNRVSASTDGYSDGVDGQIVSYSDEEDSDEDDDGKELFDSAALTALLKAASGASSNGEITFTAPDGSRIFSVDRPAGLGSSIPSLKPAAPRPNRSNIFSPTDLSLTPEADTPMDEEEKKLQEKVDQIKVKFLRLVHRLGHSPEDRVVAQVLYRLSLAEGIRRGRQIGRAFSLENAKKKALQLEEEGKEPLDFSCNILLLGKTGVGKSALINSIFGEQKVNTSAFDMATHSVKEIVGVVDGVNVRIIDTPGLRPSVMDQAANMKILNSINKYTKRCPPDIVLYVDRLDTQAWDFNDLPLLRSIATSMGPAIWFNAIVALTHGASAPPDGSSGSPLSYEVFVDQRSRVVQHAIRQAAGDMRLMNPVSLVENHPSCRRNREGQRVLPNGLAWRSQLLLLCYSSKILSEANSILKLQDSSPSKLFGLRTRSPPLPFLLSSLLQSKSHPKLTADQGVDQGDSDFDLDDLDEEVKDVGEEEDEYDRLPPFKSLRKSQLAKLTKDQKRAYYDEYEYRVKLLQKKQWKEELMRARERKKRAKQGQELPIPDDVAEDYDDDGGAPATIPVPLPDMVLPPSFDCDNPAFRYRFLEPSSQLLTRPVLDSHGWDHDCGYDGVSLEDNLSIAGKYPASVSAQITKDKKDFTIHLDSSIAAIHGENGSTLAGFDVQSVGKQLAYILRSETKFKTLKKNKTAAGVSVTFLGENVAAGMKVEDELVVGKRLGVAASAGTMRSKGDAAYGANVEIRLRDKEFPIGQDLSTLGLSLMRWRGDLALGANLQSQFSVGRGSKVAVRFGLNNKRSGQITVRLNSSEQLQIALMGIIPVAASIYRSFFAEE